MSYGTLKVLVAVLSGVIAALVTGILAVAGGVNLPAAVISGGGALVVVVPLVLLLARELGPPPAGDS
jgi:heme A synthase